VDSPVALIRRKVLQVRLLRHYQWGTILLRRSISGNWYLRNHRLVARGQCRHRRPITECRMPWLKNGWRIGGIWRSGNQKTFLKSLDMKDSASQNILTLISEIQALNPTLKTPAFTMKFPDLSAPRSQVTRFNRGSSLRH